MKKVLVLIFVVIVTGTLFVTYKTPFSYCDTPITYKIGSIDSRFNLNKAQAEVEISKAADILDAESEKKLFEYSPEGGVVTINFVYDQRTALIENIQIQRNQVSKRDTSLEEKIERYEFEVKTFLQKLENFNLAVKMYNSSNEASQEDYEELVKTQNELKTESEGLDRRASELNLETSNLNTSVNQLNQNVTEFNDALIEKPEEGLYDADSRTITVYFVNSRQELQHTLAHEFGHALGMEHVKNDKAIMYPETSEYIEFTKDDTNELERVCKSFSLLTHWIYEVIPSYLRKIS